LQENISRPALSGWESIRQPTVVVTASAARLLIPREAWLEWRHHHFVTTSRSQERQARRKAILRGEWYSNLVHRELRPQTCK
jgi:hypothetical protein